MRDGKGIHVTYVPGTFRPLANKDNDYLIDRAAQKRGDTFSGVDGIAMQDASLQESMGPIVDRTKENLVSTDNGIIMARHRLLRALKAMEKGETPPGIALEHQRVPLGRRGAAAGPAVQGRRQGGAGGADRQGARDGLIHAIRIRPHVERRRGAVPHRRAELQAARGQGDRARPAERARGEGAGAAATGTARPSSPPRRSAARRRQGESFAGWLSDLAGRTKNLIDEVNSADLVVMVAAAGESAQAASIIGEACSLKRVMTTALMLGGADNSDEALSKTLSQLRPWALMLVIASAEEYIADMLCGASAGVSPRLAAAPSVRRHQIDVLGELDGRRDLVVEELGELIDAHRHRLHAQLLQPLLHRRDRERLLRLLVQPLDDARGVFAGNARPPQNRYCASG